MLSPGTPQVEERVTCGSSIHPPRNPAEAPKFDEISHSQKEEVEEESLSK